MSLVVLAWVTQVDTPEQTSSLYSVRLALGMPSPVRLAETRPLKFNVPAAGMAGGCVAGVVGTNTSTSPPTNSVVPALSTVFTRLPSPSYTKLTTDH